jgi:hypothetical protein
MQRVALASAVALAACAASSNRVGPGPAPPASDFHSREEGADVEAGPPVSENERVECELAWHRFRTALDAATSGCASDADCEAFETCHAVTRPSVGRLWKLRGEARDSCRRVAGVQAEITCASWAPSCRQGRCVSAPPAAIQ